MPTADVGTSPASRQAALDWLLSRINYERWPVLPYQERQLKLDRMRQLLTRLGQPDAGMKIVHVAGTKGKGSTSAMIAAILTAAGYRTGVFSSPHLERIEERFAVDGEPCTAAELVALVDRLKPIVQNMDAESAADGEPQGGPTYFEITTAMAFLHFVERQVDAAVVEVGLGGRLDSTNVCLPVVSVITSISFDHMKQLGNTLASIAREKAGIIKPGVPLVTGVTNEEPRAEIHQIAKEHGCRIIQLGEDFDFDYHAVNAATNSDATMNTTTVARVIDFKSTIPGQEWNLRGLTIGMRGAHQAANAAVALAAVAELRHQGWCISTTAMRTGLSRTTLAGRVEVVPGRPEVVLDTAHNPASARALTTALGEMRPPARRTLVLSISHDKDERAIVAELVPHFDRFVVTQYQENPRAIPAEVLADTVRDALGRAATPIFVCPTPQDAWQHVIQNSVPDERVCITGSFYLTAEMRRLVLSPTSDVVGS